MLTVKNFTPVPLVLISICLLLLFASCQKIDSDIEKVEPVNMSISSVSEVNTRPYVEGSHTLLGQSRINPYTVSNMALAWQNLITRGIVYNGTASVYTTHFYVKFKPQNSDQYEKLHEDTTLAFSDYPIESNITQNGDYYHDASLPDSVPTFQYTAVKSNYQFPTDIPYDILDNLYIPETESSFQYDQGGTDDLFVDQLLNQAYTQTGNYEDTIALDNPQATLARRYTPGGQIQVFDTRLQSFIGMEGVRVQARRWFEVYDGYPDINGNFRMDHSFKRPCNYSIWFARNRFSVRHNVVNTTYWINGPKMTGDWNYNLNNGYQRFAGHVFRGAHRYHDKNVGGLRKPNRWLHKRSVYVAVDGFSHNIGTAGTSSPLINVMKIWRYSGNRNAESEALSDEVFTTTCHETAHLTHSITMNSGPIQYLQVTNQIVESWAVAVSWFISNIEYQGRGILNYGRFDYDPVNPPRRPSRFAYQYWPLLSENTYTTLFINIVDDFNEFN